jgi:hypothetical protein
MRLTFWLKCVVVGGVFPLATLAACSSTSSSSSSSSGAGGMATSSSSGSTSGSGTGGAASQTPPQGATNLQPWLAQGFYKNWHCQPMPHPPGGPTAFMSPHMTNRICTNDVLAGASAPPWPEGSAAVKEIYPDADAGVDASAPFGYAVYLKTAADSMGGATWYFYEDNPMIGGVVADGMGTSGVPLTVCVACHGASGADGGPGSGDYVWTRVTQ